MANIDVSKIVINPQYRNRLDPLTDEERERQKESIQDEGIQDALVLTSGDVLIDGHHRFDIAKELGIKSVPFRIKTFKSEAELLQWIDDWHEGRRSLTPQQRALIRGRRYNAEKQQRGGDRKSKCNDCTLIGDVAEKIASEEGVSARTIKSDAKTAELVDQLAKPLQTAYQAERLDAVIEDIDLVGRVQRGGMSNQAKSIAESLLQFRKSIDDKNRMPIEKP